MLFHHPFTNIWYFSQVNIIFFQKRKTDDVCGNIASETFQSVNERKVLVCSNGTFHVVYFWKKLIYFWGVLLWILYNNKVSFNSSCPPWFYIVFKRGLFSRIVQVFSSMPQLFITFVFSIIFWNLQLFKEAKWSVSCREVHLYIV